MPSRLAAGHGSLKPVSVGSNPRGATKTKIMAGLVFTEFAKWVQREGWSYRTDHKCWYKGNSWPAEDSATDEELLKKYFG